MPSCVALDTPMMTGSLQAMVACVALGQVGLAQPD